MSLEQVFLKTITGGSGQYIGDGCGKKLAIEIYNGPDKGRYGLVCPGPEDCVMKRFKAIIDKLEELERAGIDFSAAYSPRPRCKLNLPE